MDKMSKTDIEIEHQGVSLQEQLHAIVHEEITAFSKADQITEVAQLQEQVDQFISSLQHRFESYIHVIEQENTPQKEKATASVEPDFALTDDDLMNLEKEFDTYGIKQANGISEGKRSTKDTVIQGLVGTAIAASMMWLFWPVSEVENIVTEEVAMKSEQPVMPTLKSEPVSSKTSTKAEETQITVEPSTATENMALVPVQERVSEVAETVEKEVVPLIDGEKIKVTAHFGNVRSAPDNSGKVVSRLKKGEVVYKLEEKNGWYHVRIDAERRAWVHKSLFAPRLQIGVDVANIRTQPSAKGKIVTRLKKGDYVTKTGEQRGWYQVKLDSGKTAWAHRSIF